ncbi:MAG: cytochrome c oxidase assembly protein [Methylocystis sp.]|uniref:cytochrome c oxidase assembly protein n=1 Tax=Methylocystis sp. TaxID=1911079 RepID=UPI003DA533CA
MRKLIVLACAAAGFVTPAAAHADAAFAQAHRQAFALGAVLLLTLSYAAGALSLFKRGTVRRLIGTRRFLAFLLAVLLLTASTASPFAQASERLFATHMTQHLLLILICAPLLVAAHATVVIQRAYAPLLQTAPFRALLKAGGFVATPVAVWFWFTGLFLLWHVPALYAWALSGAFAHALEHLSFFFGAYAFWSVVMAPSGRHALGYGGRLLFVLSAALLSGLPGALIALSSRPLYVKDADALARLGLTPLEDQQLAGLVMWIPGGLAYIVAILLLLLAWMREAERRALRRSRGAGLTVIGAVLLSPMLSGCDAPTSARLGAAAAQAYESGGDPRKGAEDIAAIGCGVCHTIPGVTGAIGLVGPPLSQMGRRVYIAGLLRNTPDNLRMWLKNPQKIVPGNVMPDMGLTDEQSRDIAAYLYTLK